MHLHKNSSWASRTHNPAATFMHAFQEVIDLNDYYSENSLCFLSLVKYLQTGTYIEQRTAKNHLFSQDCLNNCLILSCFIETRMLKTSAFFKLFPYHISALRKWRLVEGCSAEFETRRETFSNASERPAVLQEKTLLCISEGNWRFRKCHWLG